MATKHTDSKGTYYLVEKGDTLWGIAVTHYNDGTKYKQLAAYNNISNPDRIYVGQKIYTTKTSSSSSSSSSSNSNAPTITAFGLQSDSDNTLFATWSWSKTKNLASYKVLWTYSTGDGVWFTGTNSSITHDKDAPATSRQSTYSIPANAKSVKFKVKPISETKTTNGKETSYWTADWSTEKTYNVSALPPKQPSTPNVTLEDYDLTASLENIGELNATSIQFQIVRNDSAKVYKTGTATITTSAASYKCTVGAGARYKVRCRSCRDGIYSEWSQYSGNQESPPAAVSGITEIRATSESSVYLAWEKSETADTYEIEYAEEKRYFDVSDATTSVTGIKTTAYEKTGLTSGKEYFFRVRAMKGSLETAWCEPKSVIIGEKPAAPTTWSSTTTAIVGESISLYWVHNSVDGSSQTLANLELSIDGEVMTYSIRNYTDDDKKDKTSHAKIDTTNSRLVWTDDDGEHTHALTEDISDGSVILWRVQTIGVVANAPSDYSVQRTIDVHAPPSLELNLTDAAGSDIETVESYPIYIKACGVTTATQSPISYHLSVKSDEIYETTDNVGNTITVNAGDEVYSKYFDIFTELVVELSAFHVNLENNVKYTIECTVTMSSGLKATETLGFNVAWTEIEYGPNAEIGIDIETYTASIRPYCEISNLVCYKVTATNGTYEKTTTILDGVCFDLERNVGGTTTVTGETVYAGIDTNGDEIYYCEVEEKSLVENVYLSVYRREFDGSFTEIGANLDGAKSTTITDPHPALDYARYRIVAVDKDTGSVSYSDTASYPVGGNAVIIQWDEAWSTYDVTEESLLEQPAWSGSLLKLTYNIDVSDSNKPDVALIEYIGRAHPVTYYGTQIGASSTWNLEIPKSDKETLYGLRRLARWMGDVYVREPSGSGYWANVTVAFSQKHCELTIPVTLNITRVEGGV